ncbi:AAA family ATPase [Clostridium cylindrosporum]|uniref:Putative kinase n=1 Tax=Clostridium cylindrosporum DSM 605 TaxID=1121307 RepID=A0A0J8D4P2_CLOCY|nr:ATP-binding protein [Clostridium cylindrosporum]KMT20787.1 putative kinase [Clostridium cylindrosporum DSM 605]
MSKLYLICGNTAAGKSTYTKKLATEKNAISFSIDQWMQTLYGDDYNSKVHDMKWLLERCERCKNQIKEVAQGLLNSGIDVIFDFTFGDFESREFYRNWAKSLGIEVSLHFLDIPVDERKRRLRKRNKEKGETFSFEVTEEMFDYVEGLFKPPTDKELENGTVIRYEKEKNTL